MCCFRPAARRTTPRAGTKLRCHPLLRAERITRSSSRCSSSRCSCCCGWLRRLLRWRASTVPPSWRATAGAHTAPARHHSALPLGSPASPSHSNSPLHHRTMPRDRNGCVTLAAAAPPPPLARRYCSVDRSDFSTENALRNRRNRAGAAITRGVSRCSLGNSGGFQRRAGGGGIRFTTPPFLL